MYMQDSNQIYRPAFGGYLDNRVHLEKSAPKHISTHFQSKLDSWIVDICNHQGLNPARISSEDITRERKEQAEGRGEYESSMLHLGGIFFFLKKNSIGGHSLIWHGLCLMTLCTLPLTIHLPLLGRSNWIQQEASTPNPT